MLDKNRVVKPLNFSVVPQEKKNIRKKQMVILKLKIPFWQCLICKLFMTTCKDFFFPEMKFNLVLHVAGNIDRAATVLNTQSSK